MKTQKEIVNVQENIGQGPGSMPQTKIDAFLEEFPLVRNYLKNVPIKQVYVSKIEPALLNYTPRLVNVAPFWHLRPDWQEEQIIFFDQDGNTLHEIKLGIKIGSSLKCMDAELAERIVYLLSYFKYTETVIIYKSPKGYSVPGWIKAQIASERLQFKKEVEAIDQEGEDVRQGKPLMPKNRLIKECPYPWEVEEPELQFSLEDFRAPLPEKPEFPKSRAFKESEYPKKTK
ncbi:MAG: hypothetical protein NT098_03765 [Candidatus Parcubacteria bacterium]|nr:hypothetical protein [Candidatus Parcubacteria bacterium]